MPKNKTILGISPGTRTIGIALIDKGALLECQVKTFKGKWNRKKLSTILCFIQSIIESYQVAEIALKTSKIISANISVLNHEIKLLARSKRIRFTTFSLGELKEFFCHRKNCTNWDLMDTLIQVEPELTPLYRKEKKNLNAHYIKSFEAIAAALLRHRQKKTASRLLIKRNPS